MLKPRNITGVFLICQVICYSVIEETAHVIGKSQSMREEGVRIDEEREREGDEGGDGGRGWGWRGGEGGADKLEAKSVFSPDWGTQQRTQLWGQKKREKR